MLCLLLAVIPSGLFFVNLRLYRPLPAAAPGRRWGVSVLIPARDEAGNIRACLESVLANEGVDLEVIVLDDQSSDSTGAIVRGMAGCDARVRLEASPPLPAGWCGKQHACHVLSRLATHSVLVFLDADVRISPTTLARAAATLDGGESGERVSLLSGIPLQITGTLMERLLIPLIHFVMLGFLPMGRMRASRSTAYGAGCGQIFVARRDDYFRAGGHAAIRQSLHDGLGLPRAFRRAGLRTDLFDATDSAICRMYRSGSEVWRGLSKNATEGMAGPAAIVPWTLILFVGQVGPFLLAVMLLFQGLKTPGAVGAFCLSCVGIIAVYAVRLVAAVRFHQSRLGAVLHPVGIVILLIIQWSALVRKVVGKPPEWKGRYIDAPNKTAGA